MGDNCESCVSFTDKIYAVLSMTTFFVAAQSRRCASTVQVLLAQQLPPNRCVRAPNQRRESKGIVAESAHPEKQTLSLPLCKTTY